MMNWFTRFLKDWIAPFYYLWIFIGIIVAVFNFLSIKSRPLVLWIAETAYEWWTGVDLAPSLTRTPDPTKLAFWVVLNSLLILLLLAIAQIFRTRRRWRFVVGEMRNCIELHLAFRQNVARMKASPSSFERARISEAARAHVIMLCTRISEIFEHLYRAKCHTSVKSFSADTGLIATRARDAQSHNAERVQADEAMENYNFSENTAFSRIISDANCYMYICNYLRVARVFHRYINRNDAWPDFYRATVVLPITLMRNKREIHKQTVIGFLCVDSKRARFQRKNARTILLVFVIMIHDVMLLLGTQSSSNIGAPHA